MGRNELQEMISNYTDDTQQDTVEASWTDVRRTAAVIRASNGFAQLPAEQLPDGGLRLRAKVTDAFCFVDHPQVELDSSGEKVSSFYCDCPDFRMDGRFCAHCVALLEERSKATFLNATEVKMDEEDEKPEGDDPKLMELSYHFCNSAWDLYPMDDHPRIPLERFKQVYGDNALAIKLYNRCGYWGGSCFGMVATSAMFNQADSGVELQEFLDIATRPSDLQIFDKSEKMGMDLRSFIEAVHILQYGYSICDYNSTLEMLADATETFQKGKGRPVCMAIFGKSGGHAIMPFRIDRTDGPEDVLHIYDPNCPMVVRYGYLTKDEAGKYVQWRFAMYDDEFYGSKYGGRTNLCHYDFYKGKWDDSRENRANLIVLKPGMALVSTEGVLMARVTQTGVESFATDVIQLPDMDNVKRDPIFSVPVGPLCVTVEDPTLEELSVSLIGKELSLDLTTEAREATICVNDAEQLVWARVNKAETRYDVKVLNTFKQLEETVLRGVTAQSGLQLVQQNGQLQVGCLAEGTALFVNRKLVSLDRIGRLQEEEERTPMYNQEAAQEANTDLL